MQRAIAQGFNFSRNRWIVCRIGAAREENFMTEVLHRRARRQTREAYLAWTCVLLLALAGFGVLTMGGTQAKSVAAPAPAPAQAAAPVEAPQPASPARAVRVISIRGAAPAPAVTTR
jgi:hypothetical protein